jgi:hypothetical protein
MGGVELGHILGVHAAARRHGRICLIGVLVAIGLVSIWTPVMSQLEPERHEQGETDRWV